MALQETNKTNNIYLKIFLYTVGILVIISINVKNAFAAPKRALPVVSTTPVAQIITYGKEIVNNGKDQVNLDRASNFSTNKTKDKTKDKTKEKKKNETKNKTKDKKKNETKNKKQKFKIVSTQKQKKIKSPMLQQKKKPIFTMLLTPQQKKKKMKQELASRSETLNTITHIMDITLNKEESIENEVKTATLRTIELLHLKK